MAKRKAKREICGWRRRRHTEPVVRNLEAIKDGITLRHTANPIRDEMRQIALELLPQRFIPYLQIYEKHGLVRAEIVMPGKIKNAGKMTKTLQRKFREAARAECGDTKAAFEERIKNCNIHHMRPRSMGGNNDHYNLVFMDRTLHAMTHHEMSEHMLKALELIQECNAAGRGVKWLRTKIHKAKGITINGKDVILIKVRWPESKVCVPEEIIRQQLPQYADEILQPRAEDRQSLRPASNDNGKARRKSNLLRAKR